MKIRFVLLLLLWNAAVGVASPLAQVSGRKIGPIRVGNIGHWGMMVSRGDRWLAFGWDEEGTGSRCSFLDRRTHAFWTPDVEMLPIAFSRDGRRLFVWCNERPLPGLKHQSSNDSYIAVYDPERRRFSRIFPDLHAPDNLDYLASGLVSRDGKTLTFVNQEGRIHAFNTRTGKLKWRTHLPVLPLAPEEPGWPVLSEDGRRSLQNRDGATAQTSQVIDTRSGRVLAHLRLVYRNPNAMRPDANEGRLAPRGPMAATFFPGTQEWFFWNTRTNRVLWKMGGPSRTTTGDLSWQFSPAGRVVAVFGPRGFEVRDARTGHVLKRDAHLRATDVAFSPDGKRLYAIGEGNGFKGDQVLWQWRLFPTRRQRRADARFMARLQRREDRFALSKRHINQSLIIAARRGDSRLLAKVLGRGVDPDSHSPNELTPIATVAQSENIYGGPCEWLQCARLLLSHGAKVNSSDTTALNYAVEYNEPVARLLLEHGAASKQTDLDAALLATASVPRPGMMKVLFERGANLNARDKDDATPLILYTKESSALTVLAPSASVGVRFLLDHGADINAKNQKGDTALLVAATEGARPTLFRFLLERGANPNASNADGNTALLQTAARFGPDPDSPDPQGEKDAIASIRLLLAHGAGINAKNKAGQTALSLAKTPAIQAALLKAGAKP